MFTKIERARWLHAAVRFAGHHSIAEWASTAGISVSAAQKVASARDVGPHVAKTVDDFIADTFTKLSAEFEERARSEAAS